MNVKKRIRTLLVIFTMSIVYLNTLSVYAQESSTSFDVEDDIKRVTQELFSSVNNQNWDNFIQLVCANDVEYYRNYFDNNSFNYGIKQIKNADINNITVVDKNEIDQQYYNSFDSDININNLYCAVAEVDCIVSEENAFFINGINFMSIVYGYEAGTLKIYQISRANTDTIEKYIEPKLSVNDENYSEEIGAIKALKSSNAGLLINNEGEYITDGFEIKKEKIVDDSISLDSYPKLNHYVTYSYPQKIIVQLNITGNSSLDVVDMNTYIQCTLPNEWMADWNTEALKAGAYCVKMVGIYRAIKPWNSAKGISLNQRTQNYIPHTENSKTNQVIASIKNCGMADSSGILFFPEYAKGSDGQIGPKACGQLKQYGSQALARKGYTCKQILNYYYSGSVYSKGDVNLFGYNIGY